MITLHSVYQSISVITGVLYVNIIYNEKLQKIADEISHMNLIQVLFGVDG